MTNQGWTQQGERGNSRGMRILLFVLNTFGYAVANLLLYPIVFYFYATGRAARHASIAYLRRVHRLAPLPQPPGFGSGFYHYVAFAKSAMDRLWFWQSKLERFQFQFEGLEQIKSYLDQGVGCLLLGAHMGNFDSLRVLCKERAVRVNAVMYLENAQRFNDLLRSINPDSQLNIINLKDRSIDGVMEMRAGIERGEIVAMLADRFHPSARSRVVISSFLGEDAPFPANPWLVASLLECPTFFVAGIKTGRRTYESVVHFVASSIRIDRRNRDTDLKKYVTEYARFLERLCCAHPYQWFNFYDFWRCDEQPDVPDNQKR